MFSIDGVTYDGVLVSSLRRSFEIRDGRNSGTAQSGKTIRDITGTYFAYELTIDASLLTPDEYDSLYEVLCAPVASHNVVFPYGQTTYQFEAEILDGSDDLILCEPDYNHWEELTITFQARKPNRVPI